MSPELSLTEVVLSAVRVLAEQAVVHAAQEPHVRQLLGSWMGLQMELWFGFGLGWERLLATNSHLLFLSCKHVTGGHGLIGAQSSTEACKN